MHMEDHDFKQKYLVDNFIVPWVSNASGKKIPSLSVQQEIEEFYDLLITPSLTSVELLLRTVIDQICLPLPSRVRLWITGLIKRVRNPNCSLKIKYPSEHQFNLYIHDLKKKLGADKLFWKGKSAVVCLSHDIDTFKGYRFSPELMRLDSNYRIPSVFNVLTHADYKLDKGFLSELMREGFEIGLHGYRHELGMARKPFVRIKTELESSLALLRSFEIEVKGFRAPGLSISPAVLSVLEDLKMSYDSSIQLCNGLQHSCGISFPYKPPGKDLWEIPLAVQDTLFFRDAGIKEDNALRIIEKIILQTIELGGVAFFNFHPCLVMPRVSFYKMFLEILAGYRDSVWIALPKDLCIWLDQKREETAET